MAWNNSKPAGHMAGQIPHGKNEPAFLKTYKGCSVYSYIDSNDRISLVMFDSSNRVKSGSKEAMKVGEKVLLEAMYKLEHVRTINNG